MLQHSRQHRRLVLFHAHRLRDGIVAKLPECVLKLVPLRLLMSKSSVSVTSPF